VFGRLTVGHWCGNVGPGHAAPVFFDLIEKTTHEAGCQHPLCDRARENTTLVDISVLQVDDIIPTT
jgi:hypothetical protein